MSALTSVSLSTRLSFTTRSGSRRAASFHILLPIITPPLIPRRTSGPPSALKTCRRQKDGRISGVARSDVLRRAREAPARGCRAPSRSVSGVTTKSRSKQVVITEKCQVFRALGAAATAVAPAHAVKSSRPQCGALWPGPAQRALPRVNPSYASTDACWDSDARRGPPPRLRGSNRRL